MRVGTETYHYDSLIKHFFCLFALRAKIRLSLTTSPKMDPTYLILLLISIPPRDTVSTEAP